MRNIRKKPERVPGAYHKAFFVCSGKDNYKGMVVFQKAESAKTSERAMETILCVL